MKTTVSRAARAVRMYVPMQPSPTRTCFESTYTSPAVAASVDAPTSKDTQTAKRLTEALLRARGAQQLRDSAPAPLPPPVYTNATARHAGLLGDDTASPAERTTTHAAPSHPPREVAMQLATAYGKAALLTHMAHQHDDDAATPRPYAYSTVDWARIMSDPAEDPNAAATAAADGGVGADPAAGSTSTPPAFRSHTSALRLSSAEDGAAALSIEVAEAWARMPSDAKTRWITSTPQGRRALRAAMAVSTSSGITSSDARARDVDAAAAGRVPSMTEMLSRYPDTLVRPRPPRSAALSPAPHRHYLRELFSEEAAVAFTKPEPHTLMAHGEVRMHSTTTGAANRASLRRKADAARAVEREKAWFQNLAGCLGGDSAAKFVNDVKSLQRPREESGEYEARPGAAAGAATVASSSSPATLKDVQNGVNTQRTQREENGEPVYSAGLLELCEELGIRSPRRAYVRAQVLQDVDAAAATADPLTLDQVQEKTAMYLAQYDSEVEAVAAKARESGNASPEQAVRDFEKYQLELAVDKVQVRLAKFQENVPLLRNCTNVFNK